VRLFRLGDEVSKVGADVRAALVSWGRGGDVLGGVAVLGCQPPGCARAVDAVLVLPRGVLVVVGVDLPDPAMRLEAPVAGQWKTDGWPLVRGDGTVNPGVEALAAASAIADRLQAARVDPMPIGTVVAVGPYVGQVIQPTGDLARGVRILHPEPSTLLTAARELAVQERPCPVAKARAILAALAPNHREIDDADLSVEGFASVVVPELATERTALIARVTDQPRQQAVATARRRRMRWLPIGATIMLGLLMITGIVVAIASTGDGTQRSTQSVAEGEQPGIVADGTTFVPKGASTDNTCANRAYGDVRASLAQRECTRLTRARFETKPKNDKIAVLVADLTFPDPAAAAAFQKVAETPGSGGISDASADGFPWPDGAKPFFESSAYTIRLTGADLRIVQAVWLDRPSLPDDPELKAIAEDALALPK
jgi:hypothetical protein